MDNIHKEIRKAFQIRTWSDNQPILAKWGGRDLLAKFLGKHGFNKGCEIGVNHGIYSKRLCKGNPNIELYSIDPWLNTPKLGAQREAKFQSTTKKLAPYNAKIMRMTSMEALEHFEDESLDFVYIDGNHRFDFVCPDIIYWAMKIRQGGIIACHDYYHHRWGGIVAAVDAYIFAHEIKPVYVTYEVMPTVFWVKEYNV